MTSRKQRIAWLLATWFGCGQAPGMPGTIGTLGAIPLYGLALAAGPTGVACAILLVTGLGIWAASVVAHDLKSPDPQVVVIDEVAGMLLTMLPVPHPSLTSVIVAFALFRVLDTTKPGPIRWFEQLPGGWGIMFDDLAAGAVGAAAMSALVAVGLWR